MKYSDTPAFVPTKLEEERREDKGRILTVRFNDEDIKRLELAAKKIQQPKLSTALKSIYYIGLHVLHEEKTSYLIDTLFKNKANNRRTGNDIIE